MKKNHPARTAEQWFSLVATAFSFVLIMLGVVSLFAIQLNLYQPQDIRKDASVANGQVTVTTSTETDNNTKQVTITFKVNTHNVQTTGLQLYAKVMSDTFQQAELTFLGSSGLNPVVYDLTNISGGIEAKILAIPLAGPTAAFSTNQDVPFAQLKFTPTKSGTVTLSFEQTESHAYVFQSNPPKDELQTIASSSFAVVVNTTTTPTTTSTTSVTTKKYCDQECANTSECESGLECRSGRCRLASNPDDTTCSLPGNTTTVTQVQERTVYDYVTKQVVVADPVATTAPTKGATTSATANKVATSSSATASAMMASPTPQPTYQPLATATPKPEPTKSNNDQSALSAVMANLMQRGLNLPLAMIGSGIIILLLVIGLIFLRKPAKKSGANALPTTPTNPKDQEYLKNLEQRIGSLKTEQQPATAPISNSSTVPVSPLTASGTPAAAPRPAGDVTPPPSTMVDRLKEKGVSTPGNTVFGGPKPPTAG